jgi:hypothetical protein
MQTDSLALYKGPPRKDLTVAPARALDGASLRSVHARKMPRGWQVTVTWSPPTGGGRSGPPRLTVLIPTFADQTLDELWLEVVLKAADVGVALPADPTPALGAARHNRTGDVVWETVAAAREPAARVRRGDRHGHG